MSCTRHKKYVSLHVEINLKKSFLILNNMDILQKMLERAKQNPQRIVLPEGDEPRTLEAANILLRDKIARLILIGNKETILRMAAEKGDGRRGC